ETLGKKIRQGKMEKVPYLLVIGDKEVDNKTVTVEGRKDYKDTMNVDELVEKLKNEIVKKTL
ncbi:His/Gly/Thr/Pro-type tRNA ligase C-terminal domain-containing protein, partial [Sulfurimonas sp.]|uniref:His/Gly/Thr/Pro-type tRNA ligase C-terminal domain-containing protein n=1 Tax=Sulfurimonas sp. TaxID=2022749 RepID=UPI0025E62634